MEAIEFVSTKMPMGQELFVTNKNEKAEEMLPVYEATGMFTVRYGVKKIDGEDDKIRFVFASQIGGSQKEFGKGNL